MSALRTISSMSACYACGTEFPRDIVITRSLECPHCSAPVRCCKNCVFYEPGAHWDCRESIPDPVFEKERSNFCDYFRLNDRGGGGSNKTGPSSRDQFDALFS